MSSEEERLPKGWEKLGEGKNKVVARKLDPKASDDAFAFVKKKEVGENPFEKFGETYPKLLDLSQNIAHALFPYQFIQYFRSTKLAEHPHFSTVIKMSRMILSQNDEGGATILKDRRREVQAQVKKWYDAGIILLDWNNPRNLNIDSQSNDLQYVDQVSPYVRFNLGDQKYIWWLIDEDKIKASLENMNPSERATLEKSLTDLNTLKENFLQEIGTDKWQEFQPNEQSIEGIRAQFEALINSEGYSEEVKRLRRFYNSMAFIFGKKRIPHPIQGGINNQMLT